MIKRLESARLVRAWAHDTLFREAEAGKRVVVCLRSAGAWGTPSRHSAGPVTFHAQIQSRRLHATRPHARKG